jgi:hypothetical protein
MPAKRSTTGNPEALERDRAWDAEPRAFRVPAIHEHERGREERHHGEPREKNGGARDDPQLLDTAEVGQAQYVERSRGHHRGEQHARSATRRRDVEGLAERATEEQLLLVAEEKVDAVVDSDADDDRDEHHREEREVPDGERGEADRPAQTHRKHPEHDHRLADAPEGDDEQPEYEHQRDGGRRLAVTEGRDHLIVAQCCPAGDADLHLREVPAQGADRLADAVDRATVGGKATLLASWHGEDEQELPVLREEVAGGAVVGVDREECPPR